MVIADINILCIQQRQKIQSSILDAQIDSFNYHIKDLMYIDRYLNLQGLEGTWYQIYPKARNNGDYNQEFMDLCINNKENRVIFCRKDFKNQLLLFLTKLYSNTQVESLYFFVDLQGYKEKYVRIKWKDFINKVYEEDILFNTVYNITK